MHPAVLELKKRLQDRYGDRIVRFLVFGSYARGDNSPESDIDVFVALFGKVDWKTEIDIFDIAYEIDLEYDILFDVKVFSEEDIQSTILGVTPFMEAVLREGQPV